MPLERDAITHALSTAPNITVAARQLGASRRTLQNRMRFYALPPGRSGRPREPLPYRSSSTGLLAFAGLVVGGILVGRWWAKRKTEVVGGEMRTRDLAGLDAILGA